MPNPVGTAPGFAARSGQSTIFCMPGVPHEMKQMFDDHVVPALRALFPDLNAKRSHVSKLRVFGLPESVVGEKLAGLEEAHRVVIGYRAHFPEIEVKFIARDADASLRIARAAAEAKERLGREAVYGEGDTTIGEVIGGMLRERRMTLAVAESATGGLVSHLVTATPASDYFLGGVTTYAESAKTELLGVPPDLLARCGAVSEEVTRAMAEGVRRRLGADVGAAVTGIAGPAGSPSGPDAAKPVGLIHCAVATPSGTIARERVYPMSREFIQKLAAFMTLATVRSALLDR